MRPPRLASNLPAAADSRPLQDCALQSIYAALAGYPEIGIDPLSLDPDRATGKTERGDCFGKAYAGPFSAASADMPLLFAEPREHVDVGGSRFCQPSSKVDRRPTNANGPCGPLGRAAEPIAPRMRGQPEQS